MYFGGQEILPQWAQESYVNEAAADVYPGSVKTPL